MRKKITLAQKMPNEHENKILNLQNFLIDAHKQTSFELRQIANKKIPLTFGAPSNKIVEVKGNKPVTLKTSGYEKAHYTVVLYCCADITKLPPLLIFKRKT